MKNRLFRLVILSAIIIILSITIHAEDAGSGTITSESYIDSIIDMLLEKYNGDITREELYEGAIKGIFEKLDKYSTYYNDEDLNSFMENITGEYEGIGVLMGQMDQYIVILKVFEDSPAEKAGLIPNDKIISADGNSLIGKTTEEAALYIKGEAGTSVELGILREGDGELTLLIERAVVELSPVTYSTFNDIGYIKLDTFSANAALQIQKALYFMDDAGIEKIILDLRNNPGGEVSQAVDVARYFVPSGLITTLHFVDDTVNDVDYYSYLTDIKYELAVLCNNNTASASEILIGAIKDSGAGKIIGTQTFGKAKVQNIFPILKVSAYEKYSNEVNEKVVTGYDLILKHHLYPAEEDIFGYCKLTTGEYYTRNGLYIDGFGIDPNYFISDYQLVEGIDIWSINKFNKVNKYNLWDTGSEVFNLEKFLLLLGYDVNTPDYEYDWKTFHAISKFQKDSDLYPYGVCDYTTQEALNRKIIDKIFEIDPQFSKAIEILK